MSFWSLFRIVTGVLIVSIVGIIALIKWNKEIDSETTWGYGIYVVLHIILSIIVLTRLEIFWTTQQ